MPVNLELQKEIVVAIKANNKNKKKNKISWDELYNQNTKDFVDTVCTCLSQYEAIENRNEESIIEYLIRNNRKTQLKEVLELKGIDKVALLSNVSKPSGKQHSRAYHLNRSALVCAVTYDKPEIVKIVLDQKEALSPKLALALRRSLVLETEKNELTDEQKQIAKLIVEFALAKGKESELELNEKSVNGTNPRTQSREQMTPLVMLMNFSPELAKQLLENENTKIDLSIDKGAMLFAVFSNDVELVKLLKVKARENNDNSADIYPQNILLRAKDNDKILAELLSGEPELQPDLSDGKFLTWVLSEAPSYYKKPQKNRFNRLRAERVRLIINSDQKDVGLNKPLKFSGSFSSDPTYTALEYAIKNNLPSAIDILKAPQLDITKSPKALELALFSRDEKLFDELMLYDANKIGLNNRNIKLPHHPETYTPLERLLYSANYHNKEDDNKSKEKAALLYTHAKKIIKHSQFDAAQNKLALFFAIKSGREDLIQDLVTHPTFTSECLDATMQVKKDYSRGTDTYTLLQYGLHRSYQGLIALLKHSRHPINLKENGFLHGVVNASNIELLTGVLTHAKKHTIKDFGQTQKTKLIRYSGHILSGLEVTPIGRAIYYAANKEDETSRNKRWDFVNCLLDNIGTANYIDYPLFWAAAGKFISIEKYEMLRERYNLSEETALNFIQEVKAPLLAAYNGNVELFKHIGKKIIPISLKKYTTHRGLLWYSVLSKNTDMVDAVLDVVSLEKINSHNDLGQSEFGEVLLEIFRSLTSATDFDADIKMINHLLSKVNDTELEEILTEKNRNGETLFARLYNHGIPKYTQALMQHLKVNNRDLLINLLSSRDQQGRAVIHKTRGGTGIHMSYSDIRTDRDEIKKTITELGLASLIDEEIKKATTPKPKPKPPAKKPSVKPKKQPNNTPGEKTKESTDKKPTDKDTNNSTEKQPDEKKKGVKFILPEQQNLEETWDKEAKDARWYGKAALISLCFFPFGIPLIISAIFAVIYAWKKAHQTVEMEPMTITAFEQSSYAKMSLLGPTTNPNSTQVKKQLVVFNDSKVDKAAKASLLQKFGNVFSKLTGKEPNAIKQDVRVYKLKV